MSASWEQVFCLRSKEIMNVQYCSLCLVTLCLVTLCLVTLCLVTFCLVTLCLVTLCLVTLCFLLWPNMADIENVVANWLVAQQIAWSRVRIPYILTVRIVRVLHIVTFLLGEQEHSLKIK